MWPGASDPGRSTAGAPGPSTSYDTDVVTVQLATGEEFRVFLKDYGYCGFTRTGWKGGASGSCGSTGIPDRGRAGYGAVLRRRG